MHAALLFVCYGFAWLGPMGFFLTTGMALYVHAENTGVSLQNAVPQETQGETQEAEPEAAGRTCEGTPETESDASEEEVMVPKPIRRDPPPEIRKGVLKRIRHWVRGKWTVSGSKR